jgi:hypothetical protein
VLIILHSSYGSDHMLTSYGLRPSRSSDKDMSAYYDCAFGSVQLFFGDQGGDRARRIVEYSAMPPCIEQWHDPPTVSRTDPPLATRVCRR